MSQTENCTRLSANRADFTGKERDVETGLDFFLARYYGSPQGRFTSPDEPLGDQYQSDPQSWNLFGYVRNNPLKNIDPSGLDCITTSNQSSGSVTVSTERGGSADTCGGTYVNGTVDVSSYSYNGNTLSWSDNSAWGGGAMTFVSGSASEVGQLGADGQALVAWPGWGATGKVVNGLGVATAAVMTGNFAGMAYGAIAGGSAIYSLGVAAGPLIPAIPPALDKLQKLGMSLEQANEMIQSPATQKLVDNLHGGNINVLQNVGDKVVRVTLDPTGQRIISAGLMRANSVTNGIASGRFTPLGK